MRIVVLSDSHKNVGRLFAAVERHLDNADLYIFLGDGLFGHTHNQYTEYLDGLYIMNPGSVGMNGDYGVIDITPKGDIMLIKEHI